jgi:hypothetical protein
MKNFWKWAGIIVAVLLLLVFFAGGVMIGLRGFGFMPMMHGGGYYSPMFGAGRMGLRMVFGLVSCLIPLTLIGLVAWGVFALGRNAGRRQVQQASPAPAMVAPAPGVIDQAPAAQPEEPVPAVETRACNHCGKPAQPDWSTCPYCGAAL